MPKLPHLSGKQVAKALTKIGFRPTRQHGSHLILVKQTDSGRKGLVVLMHREIDLGTLLEIIRQAGLKRDEFLKLL